MAEERKNSEVGFPPVLRKEFDALYMHYMEGGENPAALSHRVVWEILNLGTSAERPRFYAAVIEDIVDTALRLSADHLHPEKIRPFAEAFQAMLTPLNDSPEARGIVGETAKGIRRLRGLKEIDPNLISEEARLVALMQAAALSVKLPQEKASFPENDPRAWQRRIVPHAPESVRPAIFK